MQLRLILIGAALLIAIFADLLALRIGQTEYRVQIPTKGHQVGHGRISAVDAAPTLFLASREITVVH
jgi:hypothetical protein